ncbi:MAG: transglycosylase domain-containing protein, partial [Acidobacteria bacterium]|nr:transglycosylase domain-containing protein [Acidobacteriota bacterium]
MAVRHPPTNHVPPPVARRRTAHVVRYDEPDEGFLRRWRRRIFRPSLVVALVILTTFTIGVLGYYYFIFSERVDRLISGEIFTRSAGIYTAPKELRVGANVSAEELVKRLQRAGYVERGQQADDARGRYAANGASVEIEPGQNAVVDGKRLFPRVRVSLGKTGKGITALGDLDSKSKLDRALIEPEQISFVTGSDRQKRRIIGFQDIPPHLVRAITVTEDRTFFEHYGINLRGIMRALARRYDADPNSPIARQGGSSITQQLVKNLLLSPEYSLKRKLSEAYMSIILETRLTKQEIFALYCNEIYLGQHGGFSVNGFGQAAQVYFGKDVTGLSLPEAAFLAAIIRS